MNQQFLKTAIYCFTGTVLLSGATCKQKSVKPNMVFILADDCTKWDLGPYGSQQSITPTLDQLAKDGLKFTKCYQNAPMCSPTRHSLYTGLFPVRSGAYPNHTFARDSVKSIVNYLSPLGYRVALTGKRHINPRSVFNFEYLNKSNDPDFEAMDSFLTEVTTNNEKFCLFVCSNEPHTPWNKGDRTLFDPDKVILPDNYADTKKTREGFANYLMEINYLDGQVKKTLDLLEKHNLDKNTVVVFASEQGNAFPFAKWTCYNAGLSSALIVRWPGVIQAGSVSDALVEYTDILPTFIDLAGGASPEMLDGASLLPIFKGETDTHKKYTYGIHTTRGIYHGAEYFPIRSVSDGTYRLIINLTPEMEFQNATTQNTDYFKEWESSNKPSDVELSNKYKFRPQIELYNDSKDSLSQFNLAEDPQYAEKIDSLKNALEEWMLYCGDEGLATELRALERMNRYSENNRVTVVTELLSPNNNGNLTIKKDGYYTFYLNKSQNLYIDGQLIIQQKTGNTFGVAGLKKGKHTLSLESGSVQNIQIDWSGPEMTKRNLKINL